MTVVCVAVFMIFMALARGRKKTMVGEAPHARVVPIP
jgi:hypothetical protein